MKRNFCRRSTRTVFAALATVTAFAAGAPLEARAAKSRVPAFDDIVGQGAQCVVNGSFEEMDSSGEKLEGWGVYKTVTEHFGYVQDAKASKHGAQYMTFSPPDRRIVYAKLNTIPSGPIRVSVWVKGEGRVYFVFDLPRKGWRAKKIKSLGRFDSEWFTVNSKEWTHVTAVIDIPESVEIEGQIETPESVNLQVGVEGSLAMDAFVVAPEKAWRELSEAPPAPAATKTTGDGPPLPFFTAPKLARAPEIDGKLAPGEWDGAAAVTGFMQLDTCFYTPRQTVVYTGYDDARLYVAFSCPHEGYFGKGEKTPRDEGFNNQTEYIEVWLVPPDGNRRQFLGSPAGAIIDNDLEQRVAWNPDWQFANHVEDLPETVAGVMTFNKKLWTSEIAVAFDELGVPAPKPGEQWRVNFTRDFSVPKGSNRSNEDWTTWSPVQGLFREDKLFGTVTFGGSAPVVQWTGLGDLVNGDLTAEGALTGGKATVQLRASFLEQPDKTLAFAAEPVVANDGPTPFEVSKTLNVAGATKGLLTLRALAEDGRSAISQIALPFTAAPALRTRLVPLVSKGILKVHADASRLEDLPPTRVVESVVYRGDSATPVKGMVTWDKDQTRGDLSVDISSLPPSEYQVKTFVRAAPSGDALMSAVDGFVLPERPEWLGNRIGATRNVLPPWKPVKVEGARVEVTQRSYELGLVGLPRQVVSLGEPLFASPPGLVIESGGRRLEWTAKPLAQTDRADDRVEWALSGAAGDARIEGTLAVEFDGFALLDFELSAARPTNVDAVYLEFPFHPERAIYARGANPAVHRGESSALLDYDGKPGQVRACDRPIDLGAWSHPNRWFACLFVGDDHRGFEVLCETEENLKGKRRTVIEQTEAATTLRVYLIDGACQLDVPLEYRYMWQATPVRPYTNDPKVWHTFYRTRDDSYTDRIYCMLDYWALKWQCYPEVFLPKRAFIKHNQPFMDDGVKIVPYFGTNIATMEAPELKPFLKEWEINPPSVGSSPRGAWQITCPTTSYSDRVLYSLKGIVENCDMDGLYLDVSGSPSCKNHYHGCGWWDEAAGEWRPTVSILAVRQLYRRMYNYLKSEGRDGVIFHHGMPPAPYAGFVDVVTQGEDWCVEGKNQYDNLSSEVFRAKEMRIQYGVPFTFYAFHHYYRGIPFGGRIPLTAMLTYTLPHWTIPTEGRVGMVPVWKFIDQFWTTSEWIPHWSDKSPVRTGAEKVYGTVYAQPDKKRAFLIVTNWNTDPREVTVRIDVSKIGLDPAKVVAERGLEHPILQPEDPPEADTADYPPVVFRDGEIALRLLGRNLEALVLKEK